MKNHNRIGILTITPNIGFGGIMQAYALQNAVKSISENIEVEIINYRHKSNIKSKLAYLKNSLKRLFFHLQYVKFSEEAANKYIGKNLLSFHEKYLNYSTLVFPGTSFQNLINNRYSAVIVGSDQVWRPKYVLSIKDYYLDGISDKISKIAYAASLGASNWEYNQEETKCCKRLINKFGYISIRESEGIDLLKANLPCTTEIYNDIDPTLLLAPENYNRFLSRKSSNSIFTYILDKTQDKDDLVAQISNILKLPVYSFNTGAENASLPLKERVAPSIEEWLSGIANSEFIITDSFHGCVFSIIFNKPFIVYANKDRGANRFTSLLGKIDLLNKMVFSSQEFNEKLLRENVDWGKINSKLNDLREISINRLSKVIGKNLQD